MIQKQNIILHILYRGDNIQTYTVKAGDTIFMGNNEQIFYNKTALKNNFKK